MTIYWTIMTKSSNIHESVFNSKNNLGYAVKHYGRQYFWDLYITARQNNRGEKLAVKLHEKVMCFNGNFIKGTTL